MYKNDYCKPCLQELNYEELKEYDKEHPYEKSKAKWWDNTVKFSIEERKQRRREKNKKYHRTTDTLRSKVRNGLRNISSKRFNSFNDLIGCSFAELRKQLESRFTEGMSWENFGFGWQLDHIIPCWVYDLKNIEEQKKCFHYTNLQPMWAMENFEKNLHFKTEFYSLDSLNQFVSTHKLPGDVKIKTIKMNQYRVHCYRIIYKQHF